MAEESVFNKIFGLENNPAIKNIAEEFSYDNVFPQGIMGALKGPGSLNAANDYEGNAASDYLDNLNSRIENYMSSDSDTQGQQLLKKILEGFRTLGEKGFDVLEFPGEKVEEGIEFLQSPSDLRLAEAAKEDEIENQRRLSAEILDPSYQDLLDDADQLSDFGFIDVTQFDVEKQKKAQDAAKFADEKLNLQGPNFVPVAKDKLEPELEQDKGTPEPTVEDGFAAAMKDFMASAGKDLPSKNESRSDSIARYKKEFEEVTGIDASGKVDKSRFLMALGLNLMQNQAGKDFNLSRIVDAGAKSVEEAMPFLDKAVAKSEAASLAAGKFALDEIKAGESAAAAFNKEVRTNAFNWALKKMELEEKANIEKLKNKGKSNEIKNVASVPIGAGDIKVRIGDINGVSKFASGPTDAGAIVNAYTKYTEGQGNISIMGDALTAISNKDSSAVSILADRAKSLGVAWGVVDGKDMFGEKGISDEAEFEKYRQATINAFKKLILQESQVSNLDLTTLFASFGEVSFMKNPKEAEAAIDLMNEYFSAKKRSLEPVLANFYDRSWYRSDEDYKRAQEELSKLSGAYKIQATTGEGGRLSLDLTVSD